MTIEEAIREMLNAEVMPDHAIDTIIQRAKDDPALADMTGRWNDDREDYLNSLLAALWVSVRRITLSYIDEVMPEAWNRSLFE